MGAGGIVTDGVGYSGSSEVDADFNQSSGSGTDTSGETDLELDSAGGNSVSDGDSDNETDYNTNGDSDYDTSTMTETGFESLGIGGVVQPGSTDGSTLNDQGTDYPSSTDTIVDSGGDSESDFEASGEDSISESSTESGSSTTTATESGIDTNVDNETTVESYGLGEVLISGLVTTSSTTGGTDVSNENSSSVETVVEGGNETDDEAEALATDVQDDHETETDLVTGAETDYPTATEAGVESQGYGGTIAGGNSSSTEDDVTTEVTTDVDNGTETFGDTESESLLDGTDEDDDAPTDSMTGPFGGTDIASSSETDHGTDTEWLAAGGTIAGGNDYESSYESDSDTSNSSVSDSDNSSDPGEDSYAVGDSFQYGTSVDYDQSNSTVNDAGSSSETMTTTSSDAYSTNGVVTLGDGSSTFYQASADSPTNTVTGTDTSTISYTDGVGLVNATTSTDTLVDDSSDGTTLQGVGTVTLGLSGTIVAGSQTQTLDVSSSDGSSVTSGTGQENDTDTAGDSISGTWTPSDNGGDSSSLYEVETDFLGLSGSISAGYMSYDLAYGSSDNDTPMETGTETLAGPTQVLSLSLTSPASFSYSSTEQGSVTLGDLGTITSGSDSYTWDEFRSSGVNRQAQGTSASIAEVGTDLYSLYETGIETEGIAGVIVSGSDGFTWNQNNEDDYCFEQSGDTAGPDDVTYTDGVYYGEDPVGSSLTSLEFAGSIDDSISSSWRDVGSDSLGESDSICGGGDSYTWTDNRDESYSMHNSNDYLYFYKSNYYAPTVTNTFSEYDCDQGYTLYSVGETGSERLSDSVDGPGDSSDSYAIDESSIDSATHSQSGSIGFSYLYNTGIGDVSLHDVGKNWISADSQSYEDSYTLQQDHIMHDLQELTSHGGIATPSYMFTESYGLILEVSQDYSGPISINGYYGDSIMQTPFASLYYTDSATETFPDYLSNGVTPSENASSYFELSQTLHDNTYTYYYSPSSDEGPYFVENLEYNFFYGSFMNGSTIVYPLQFYYSNQYNIFSNIDDNNFQNVFGNPLTILWADGGTSLCDTIYEVYSESGYPSLHNIVVPAPPFLEGYSVSPVTGAGTEDGLPVEEAQNLQDFSDGTDQAEISAPTSRATQTQNKPFQDYLRWGVSGPTTGGPGGPGGGTLPLALVAGGATPAASSGGLIDGSSSSTIPNSAGTASSPSGLLGGSSASTPNVAGSGTASSSASAIVGGFGAGGSIFGYASQVSDSIAMIDSAPQSDSIATAGTVGDTTVVEDPNGDVTSETNPLGDATSFAYDSSDQRTAVTDALGNVTSIAYDPAGDVVSVTDPDGNKTTYEYDSEGRLVRMTDPLGNSATYAYNAAGLLASTTDRDGRRRDFFYNAAGQITAENWYDANGNLIDELRFGYDAQGQLISASSDEGAYTFTYDVQGRLIRETEPFGLWLAFSYDAAGDRTGVQDSFGGDTVSTYNAQGELISRQLAAPGQVDIGVSLVYTANGEVDTLTRSARGSTVGSTDYSYDDSGDVTGIAHLNASGNVLDGFIYAYDAAGQVTSETDFGGAEDPIGPTNWALTPAQLDAATLAAMLAGNSTAVGTGTASSSASGTAASPTGGNDPSLPGFDPTIKYTYDADGQLIAAGSQAYQYDANGNRINPGYVIGPDNQILSDGTWDYTYDADGNEIGKTNIATGVSWAYGYDDANQMTSATEYAAGSKAILAQVTYTYDVFGNRLQQTTFTASTGATTVQRYGYDGQNVWADLNSSNQLETRYLYGDAVDQILARMGASGVVAWYLTDRLGSVRDIMNDSGAILDHRNYDGFGNIVYDTNAAAGDQYGYTGLMFDITTGLQYNRTRYYDPKIGRWTSQDQDGFDAGESNLYCYVGNQATNFTDPLGEFGEGVAMGKNRGGSLNPNNITNRDGHGAEVIENLEGRMVQFGFGAVMAVSGIAGAIASSPTGAGPVLGVAVAAKGFDNMQAAIRGTDTYVGQATKAVVTELGGSEKQAAVASVVTNLATDIVPGAVLSKTLSAEQAIANAARGGAALDAEAAVRSLTEAESVATKRIIQDVYIVGKDGKDIGQMDVFEIDATGRRIFIESKDGTGIGKLNPKTGKPFQDPAGALEQFGENQILGAGRKKATALRDGVATRGDGASVVPSIDEIQKAKNIRFEIKANTPEMKLEVEKRLQQLRSEFPDFTFEATFGS
jgi:RHS repeat-associated protein